MAITVYKKEYKAPEIDAREALRYAGVRGDSPESERLLSEVVSESAGVFTYNVVYARLSAEEAAGVIGVATNEALASPEKPYSRLYSERLFDVSEVILFAASVGVGVDRMIRRYCVSSPSRAVMLDALGSERVEALLDAFCEDMNVEAGAIGCRALPRFSPGYGDLPLALQSRILTALDAPRILGVGLNESLLMSPSKSVTAIMGIARHARLPEEK